MRGTVAELINIGEKRSITITCSKEKVILNFDHDLEFGLGKEVIISGTISIDDISVTSIKDKE